MKRPLFPDGFLINAHHSHPSACQEEPPPSFLSPRARPLLLFPGPWGGQVERPLGVGGCQEQRWQRAFPCFLLPGLEGEPSTCWRAALCVSRFRSQPRPLGAPGTSPGLCRSSPSSQASRAPSLARSQSSEPEVNCFLYVSVFSWWSYSESWIWMDEPAKNL